MKKLLKPIKHLSFQMISLISTCKIILQNQLGYIINKVIIYDMLLHKCIYLKAQKSNYIENCIKFYKVFGEPTFKEKKGPIAVVLALTSNVLIFFFNKNT